MRTFVAATALLAVGLLTGCRGMESENPPIHPNLNMDYQEKFLPQERNPFFANDAAMRPPVSGTVARGLLHEDTEFYFGRTEGGALVEEMPVPLTRELLQRGQARYNVYCIVCHGRAGAGNGVVITGDYGFNVAPAAYYQERLREVSDGYLFDVITNGYNQMPSYAQQIPVADRWAIVAYVRALQRSQSASRSDVPPGVLEDLDRSAPAAPDAGAADTSSAPAASATGDPAASTSE